GVDLNGNFGYMWGFDNSGSSPTPSSNTYRGTAPFSEPETQIVKEFAETFDFSLALNNHTYSDLLIYPWGYQNQLTPDGEVFSAFASLMTRENNYTYGTCYETLSYFANGGSDDWFYGEQQTKNKVFAFTPEAGSPADGFWPAMSRIEEICAGHTGMNLYLARLALAYAEVAFQGDHFADSHEFSLPFEIKNYGLESEATFTVSVNPISPLITSVSDPMVFENLDLLETANGAFQVSLHPATYDGLMFDFEVLLNNGAFVWRDTLKYTFGEPPVLFADQFQSAQNWTGGTWGLDAAYYVSAPYSMSDSPGGQYGNNLNNQLTLVQTIDLTDFDGAFAEFKARWDIETNWDYVQFMVSENGGSTWVPMAGNYTVIGSSNQDAGKPIYHGIQSNWISERIDLGAFAGKEILVRFRLVSDASVTRDGFYFDDFRIIASQSFEPQPPVITGQEPLTILMAESFTMDMDWIFVEDNFVSYPQGHALLVLPGENYEVEEQTIIPDPEFFGMLQVMVKVNNGLFESEVYPFQVEVLNTMSSGLEVSASPQVYYDQNRNGLVIVAPDGMGEQKFLLSVIDMQGRQLLRNELLIGPGQHFKPLQIKPGIYVFELKGKETLSGKFPVF
ncbi:MAG: immune inhibitor A, partial [Bacteroidales bacterium]|nr:immune inhibitor A [Bacteroidales bacterium]